MDSLQFSGANMILKCFKYNQHFVAMMNIINLARIRNVDGNFERHHVIPRCFFKVNNLPVDNSEANLVNLTREEHRKVHHLAMLCVSSSKMKANMAYACHVLGLPASNYHHTAETIEKIRKSNKGKKRSAETCKRISEVQKGKPGHRLGIKWSDAEKERLSIAHRGKSCRYPRSDFGRGFVQQFGLVALDDTVLYFREYRYYNKNGHFSWEKQNATK